MTATITAKDVQKMVRHWLKTPVNGYLGSDYGQDPMALVNIPFKDSSVADEYLRKLRRDVSILDALPPGSVNLYAETEAPDKERISIDVAGQMITVNETNSR